MLSPLHTQEAPNGRLSGVGSAQAGRHGVGNSGTIAHNSFCASKFCSAQKNFFQTYDKNKNLSPVKIYFDPPKS